MRPKLSRPLGRAVAVLSFTVLAAAGAGVIAPQASAASSTTLTPTSWAFVDLATPLRSHVEPQGDAPIGASRSAGVLHVTRSYFTFDLTPFVGGTLNSAVLSTGETSVADCSVTTTPQAWLTDTTTRPTWVHQPARQTELPAPTLGSDCPGAQVTWDATAALADALAAGRTTVTIGLMLPSGQEVRPANGLTVDPAVHLQVRDERAPVATALTVDGKSCADQPLFMGRNPVGHVLGATVTDADNDLLSAEFDLWPVDHPDQITTFDSAGGLASGSVAKASVPQSLLADATTYAWDVRVNDGTRTGPASATCHFTTDFTAPPAPTVTSTDYPPGDVFPGHGGSGEFGTFTFSSGGDPDVIGYEFGSTSPTEFVAAGESGGSATAQFAPPSVGPSTLVVASVNRAGDFGPSTTYEFVVADNRPTVTCTPETGFIGTPRQCTFTPKSTDVVGYQYSVNSGPTTTVPAGADGTATVTVTPTDEFGAVIAVRAELANGNVTAQGTGAVQADAGAPTVDQTPDEAISGTPIQFTFHAVLPGSVSFTYVWEADDPVTVPVGPDATATVTVIANDQFFPELTVFSTTASGLQSGVTFVFPLVDSNAPAVTSTDYPEFSPSGGIGVPGTFTFTSPVSGVTGYTYTLNDDDPVTVPSGPDGSADAVITPTTAGDQTLVVTSTLADGSVSDDATYDFDVNETTPAIVAGGAQLSK